MGTLSILCDNNMACPYPYRPVVRVSDKVVDALLTPTIEVYLGYAIQAANQEINP